MSDESDPWKLLKSKKKRNREESDLNRVLLRDANYFGYFWRNNTGAYKIESDSGSRFIKYGHNGSGDIIGVVKSRAVAIEDKSKTGKQLDSQKEFQYRFEKNGGLYILAKKPDDALNPIIGIYENKNICIHCGRGDD